MMHERDPIVTTVAEMHAAEVEHPPGEAPRNAAGSPDKLRTATRVLFIVFVAVTFAWVARAVVLPVLIAWVAAMMLKPLRWLRLCRLPNPLSAGIIVTLGVVSLSYGTVRLGSPAVEWLKTAPENVTRLKQKFQHILRPAVQLSEAASNVGNLDANEPNAKKSPPLPVEVKSSGVSSAMFSWTGSLLAGIGETVALVFLLLASGDVLVQKLVRVMPTVRDKKQALAISHEIQSHISQYLFSVGLINICFGALVGLALQLSGMPNAVMWGGVAALLNFIPYFGPVVGMLLVALGGLFAFNSLGEAMLPAAAYLVLHLIEADAVTPFVLGRRFTLNPVIIFVALIFFMWLWGVLGALLAMPLLVTLKVICERVPAMATVGEFLAGEDRLPLPK